MLTVTFFLNITIFWKSYVCIKKKKRKLFLKFNPFLLPGSSNRADEGSRFEYLDRPFENIKQVLFWHSKWDFSRYLVISRLLKHSKGN